MRYEEALRARIELEKKYVGRRIVAEYSFFRNGDGGIGYHDDSYCCAEDSRAYSRYSDVVHAKGLRADIERELLRLGIVEMCSANIYTDDTRNVYYIYKCTSRYGEEIFSARKKLHMCDYIRIFLFLAGKDEDKIEAVCNKTLGSVYIELDYEDFFSVYHYEKGGGAKFPKYNKNKIARMRKLCLQWRALAKKEHYNITGVHRRLIEKRGLIK